MSYFPFLAVSTPQSSLICAARSGTTTERALAQSPSLIAWMYAFATAGGAVAPDVDHHADDHRDDQGQHDADADQDDRQRLALLGFARPGLSWAPVRGRSESRVTGETVLGRSLLGRPPMVGWPGRTGWSGLTGETWLGGLRRWSVRPCPAGQGRWSVRPGLAGLGPLVGRADGRPSLPRPLWVLRRCHGALPGCVDRPYRPAGSPRTVRSHRSPRRRTVLAHVARPMARAGCAETVRRRGRSPRRQKLSSPSSITSSEVSSAILRSAVTLGSTVAQNHRAEATLPS